MKPFLLFFMLIFSLQAKGSWELDVKYSPPAKQYLVKVIRWDVDDSSRNPLLSCYSPMTGDDSRCRIFIYYNSPLNVGYFDESFYLGREASYLRTMGELADLFARKGYLNRAVNSRYVSALEKHCYALAYQLLSGPIVPMDGGALDCTMAEIIPTYCSIEEPYIELDHGSIASDGVNGHTVSSSFRAACNKDFKLLIVAQGGKGDLQLGGGITSHLKVNGDDLGIGHEAVVGPAGKTFTLSSTLSGSPSGVGEFQGSKVIILSIP
ncbi:hypothetical protein R9X37_14075 [Serratia marcescens]|uniref:MrpH family fimbial adhesin n=1 Tax=Serratia marcescens TaxID=615 RepID=UPI00298E3BF5|nr:hypothetical protein [Serratia marcescens]MDW7736488.1 hypothetical protein [Serratia marcescens]